MKIFDFVKTGGEIQKPQWGEVWNNNLSEDQKRYSITTDHSLF